VVERERKEARKTVRELPRDLQSLVGTGNANLIDREQSAEAHAAEIEHRREPGVCARQMRS
jgi:hypothetical protein